MFLLDILMIFGVGYSLYMYNEFIAAAFSIYIIHGVIKTEYTNRRRQALFEKLYGKNNTDSGEK